MRPRRHWRGFVSSTAFGHFQNTSLRRLACEALIGSIKSHGVTGQQLFSTPRTAFASPTDAFLTGLASYILVPRSRLRARDLEYFRGSEKRFLDGLSAIRKLRCVMNHSRHCLNPHLSEQLRQPKGWFLPLTPSAPRRSKKPVSHGRETSGFAIPEGTTCDNHYL
jgi:hypothetical protein